MAREEQPGAGRTASDAAGGSDRPLAARPFTPGEADPRDAALHEVPGEERLAWQGGIIRVDDLEVTLPDGTAARRDVVRHPGGVCVAALTDDGLVPLVRQYRAPFDAVTVEVPAGKLEPGEDPGAAVRRELEEETGFRARCWREVTAMAPSPGYTDELVHIYVARDLSFAGAHPDADEFLNVDMVRLEDAVAAVLSGDIVDAKTQVALLALAVEARRP